MLCYLVTYAFWMLSPSYKRMNDGEIALQFGKCANFPHCLRAVDGKHIEIINSLGSMYFNYKGYLSVVLMAVADADYWFVYVYIGGYSKDCNSTIFQQCTLW